MAGARWKSLIAVKSKFLVRKVKPGVNVRFFWEPAVGRGAPDSWRARTCPSGERWAKADRRFPCWGVKWDKQQEISFEKNKLFSLIKSIA